MAITARTLMSNSSIPATATFVDLVYRAPAAATEVAGVLTANAAGDIGTAGVVDGVLVAVNDSVLVAYNGADARNGIYTVTSVGLDPGGGSGAPWVLTRRSDRPSGSTALAAQTVQASEGTVRAGVWTLNTGNGLVVGTNTFSCVPVALINVATSNVEAPVTAGSAATMTGSHGIITFAIADALVTVTHALVTTTNCTIQVTPRGAFDATATAFTVTPGAGSFTITANAAATAETKVSVDITFDESAL
jgi:hypothetical protein